MITANTNNLYGHQLDNIRKRREQFVQLPEFFLKHKLTVLWMKPPDFTLGVFVYFWHHVDRLGKLPSKEQQLSRTQHFILKVQAAIFSLHRHIRPMQNTTYPYDTTTELSPINRFTTLAHGHYKTRVKLVVPLLLNCRLF